jgi:hypothetical protein
VIVREMRIALSLARMLERYPRLSQAVFFSDGEALDRYLDIPAGTGSYREFRKWLLKKLPTYILRTLVRGSHSHT